MITYNDMPVVRESIESIYSQVERIVAVDGRYKDFPGDSLLSDDGTFEYLQSLDKVTLIAGGGTYEHDKRNMYFAMMADGQPVLVLDSDEVVVGKLCEPKADIGLVKLKDGNFTKYLATRLFKYRKGFLYRGVHYVLQDGQGRPFNRHNRAEPPFTSEQVDSFYIEHRHGKRSDERRFAKDTYYKKLRIREQKYRRACEFHIR